MIIEYDLLIPLITLASLVCAVIFAFVWAKLRGLWVYGGFLGFVVCLGAGFVVLVMAKKLYVVDEANKYSHYAVFGHQSYTMSSGKKVKITATNNKALLINDSKTTLEVMNVVHKTKHKANTDIKSMETKLLSASVVEYFFDNIPPKDNQIRIVDSTVRLWVKVKGKKYE